VSTVVTNGKYLIDVIVPRVGWAAISRRIKRVLHLNRSRSRENTSTTTPIWATQSKLWPS